MKEGGKKVLSTTKKREEVDKGSWHMAKVVAYCAADRRRTGWTEVMNAVIKLFQLQRGLFLRYYKGNNLSPLIGPVSFLLALFDLPAYCLDVSHSIANLGQF